LLIDSLLKAASHRIQLRLAIRFMANCSLHTVSVDPIGMNFFGFDWLPAYLKLFYVSRIAWLSVMVFLLHVRRLTLAISRFASRNPILCEAAFTPIMESTYLNS